MQTLTTYTGPIFNTDNSGITFSYNFGNNIYDMNDTYMITGDYISSTNGRGRAVIYKNTGSGYNYYQSIESPNPIDNNNFPWVTASISGNLLLLCDRKIANSSPNVGGAYIYKDNGLQYNLIQTILNPTLSAEDFSSGAYLHEDYLFIGAQAYDGGVYTNDGIVYVYTRDIGGDTYTQSHTVKPSELSSLDLFGGGHIHYDGSYLYVGMFRDDDSGSNAGAIFIFPKQNTGNAFQSETYFKINIGDFNSSDEIGRILHMAVQGDFIYASTIENNTGQGEVYVFKKDTGVDEWSKTTTLLSHIDNSITISNGDEFGESLYVYEEFIVIGAPLYTYDSADYGGVFVFKRDDDTGTSFTHKYTLLQNTNDRQVSDFGFSSAIYKNDVYVGARLYDDIANDDKGALFHYELSEFPTNGGSSSSPLTSLTIDQTLTSNNVANSNRFGRNFSVRDNYMCVMDNYTSNQGILHIYKFSNGQYTRLTGLIEPSITENISNTTSSYFGNYSDINDGWVVVGLSVELFDTNNNGTENQHGAVVVYKNVSDTFDIARYNSQTNTDGYQVLFPTVTSTAMLFGAFCSIDGNYIAIGAPLMDNSPYANDGSVYVFQLSSGEWSQMQKINSPNAENDGYFGRACIIRGDYLLIGAWNEDVDGNTGEGRAYLYYNNSGTWTHWYTLQMANGGSGDNFAFQGSVSMDVNTGYAVIGAYNNTTSTGKIYIYNDITTEPGTKPTLITEDTAIVGSSSTTNEEFGRSVCIDGLTIVVGSPADDDNGTDVGRTYIYYYSGTEWLEYAKFQNSTLENGEKFGSHVGVSNSNIVISSQYKDVSGTTDAGEVYLYIEEVCFLKETLIKTKDGYKCIEDLKRGEYIYVKNDNFDGYQKLNRLVVSPGSTRKYIRFNKNSIDGLFEDLYITRGHPIYYNNDYYNPEDFANNNNYNVEYIELSPELLYTLQFEEHYNIIANGMYVTSLPPYTNYKNKHLPKELYFNPEKFNEDNIGKMYPPYMLHDDPIPLNKSF